jgi:superfamily II DNA or RNA helicase
MSSLLDYVESLSREYEEEFERTQSSLPPLSVEQTLIVESFPISNVIVDAVAGSGKTTTILSAAKSVPSKLCLLLTYNTKLCKETE